MKIAMWSGPRNLSTALMYSFGARGDCAVVDEPFYAAYLNLTGLDHPMRENILASQNADPAAVASGLMAEVPGGKEHFYQKHMTQHMVPGVPRDWMKEVRNVFLIRHPARVVASYARKRESPMIDDIGFRQQADLFDELAGAGQAPLVIESAEIRANPPGMLEKLCAALGLDWRPEMLRWPAGGHSDDGVWATHWYGAVHRSTGFAGPEGDLPELKGAYAALAKEAEPYYWHLHAKRLQ